MGESHVEPAGAREASLLAVFTLPFPWPPPADVAVMHDAGSGLSVYWTSRGRIKVEGCDPQGRIVAIGESARLRPRAKGHILVILSAVWKRGENEIELRVNGALTNARTGLIRLDAVDQLSTALPLSADVDLESENMRNGRRNRAADYRRMGVDERRQAEDFRRETRLLEAALLRLQGGNADEIVSVSGHLRKIIGRGKGNHALQDYAALNDLRLDVWAVPPAPPGTWTLRDLRQSPDLWVPEVFSNEPTALFAQPTDLDVWLTQTGGAIAGVFMSNGDFLHAIADKIGAHLDIGQRLTLDRLALAQQFDVNSLTQYLIDLAIAVLARCRSTFASVEQL